MERQATAFAGVTVLASGALEAVARAVHAAAARGVAPILVFDDATGRVIDLDLRGSADEAAARIAPPRGRGRPKLGVTAREVTLLPRHWDWLASQPGGASATLRRLIEAARREETGRRRQAQEAAYRVMQALGGDLPGYEEALRALFAGDIDGLAERLIGWPGDLRSYVLRLAAGEAAA